MKLLTFSLAVAGVLLVASCSSTPVSPTSQEKFPGCPDVINEPLREGESPTAKTQRPPSPNSEQSNSEKNPGCILEGTN